MSSRSVGGAAWSYSRTLKDPDIEEPINLALHRPLAFRLLRPLERWTRRPSPNQVTLLSGAFGFASAYVAFVAAAGDVAWLRLAALLLFAGRFAGKLASAELAMRFAGAPDRVRRNLGLALVPQAGVAVGLVLLILADR